MNTETFPAGLTPCRNTDKILYIFTLSGEAESMTGRKPSKKVFSK